MNDLKSKEDSDTKQNLTPAARKSLFDDLERLIRNFISIFIESKNESVSVNFPQFKCELNSKTVLVKIKKNNLELKYTLGSRQILINNMGTLNPIQTSLFIACLEFVNKDVVETTNIGTYTRVK
ncbi:hypothetical protein HOH45_01115 [bacterium]|nr:hypothetical protein [bacterium]